MGWNAKRTGGYGQNSQEYADNVLAIYSVLTNDYLLVGDAWSYEAIVGILCNIAQECGMNPWAYNGSRYGLVQTTFSHYQTYGSSYPEYAPSTGASASGDGAQPTDGIAQLRMCDSPSGTLYDASSLRLQEARDLGWAILEWDDLSSYKICDDVEQAVQAWLLFYEHPASAGDLATLRTEYNTRIAFRTKIEEILGGGPVPPTPTTRSKMPLYMYTLKRYRQKKGLV